MSLRSLGAVAVLTTSALCAAPAAWAQDATVHQVYQAAEAGKFIEAQAMMDKVLHDHPNSGKAHFIEAELLARQGKFTEARTELANAERLAPGLPFAKPATVQKLKALVAPAQRTPAAKAETVPDAAYVPAAAAADLAPESNGMPWGRILVLGTLTVLFIFWLRKKGAGREAVQQRYSQTAGPAGTDGMGASYPQYANAGSAPYAPPAPGAGLGSRIAGGLATGAAMGAGVVAGEALMRHFTDGNRGGNDSNANHLASGADPLSTPDPLFSQEPPAGYDMGGDDFGVSDPGSWDDGGGGGGGDEWN